MKLKILTVPNPILRQISKPVTHISEEIKKLVTDMVLTLQSGPKGQEIGVGLSAIQVGQPVRLFLAKLSDREDIRIFTEGLGKAQACFNIVVHLTAYLLDLRILALRCHSFQCFVDYGYA